MKCGNCDSTVTTFYIIRSTTGAFEGRATCDDCGHAVGATGENYHDAFRKLREVFERVAERATTA